MGIRSILQQRHCLVFVSVLTTISILDFLQLEFNKKNMPSANVAEQLSFLAPHIALPKELNNTTKNTNSSGSYPQTQRTRQRSSSSSNGKNLVVDIISIGSRSRPDYQQAQRDTFGSHATVRNFFAITEDDDGIQDQNCSFFLTNEDVYAISSFCLSKRPRRWPQHSIMHYQHHHYARKTWLEKKSNPVGWMCAQKRPVYGLQVALENYREMSKEQAAALGVLPDYVFLMDDDTYYAMDAIQETLMRDYENSHDPALSSTAAYALAGCLVRNRVKESNFTLPFGGWGTILSRGAIVNLMRPVHCQHQTNQTIASQWTGTDVGTTVKDDDDNENDFVANACHRLVENHLNEAHLFRDGMSIGDLMVAYVSSQPFVQHANWTHGGYCLHSDWIIGFFLNYYNIGGHSQNQQRLDVMHDRMRGYRGSEIYTGRQTAEVKAQYRECNHGSPQKCTSSSHICHYQTPERMKELAAAAAAVAGSKA